MRFEETFTVEKPPEAVWGFFDDPKRLALCVPGVESVEPLEDGRSKVRMTQKVGYLSATFDLKMHVSGREEGKALEVTSIGRSVRGAIGELRSTNRVELTPEGEGTRIDLTADVGVGGMLGSVGQKVMASKAKEVARQFAANVSERLEQWSANGAPAGGPGEGGS
jgi:carbon monoxide dehydrogenase subunit G